MKRTAKSLLGRLTQLGVFLCFSSHAYAVNLNWNNHDFLNHEFTTYHCQPGYDNSRKPEQCLWSEPEATTPQCGRGQTLNAAKNQCLITQAAVKYCAAGGVLLNGNKCKKTINRGIANMS